MKISIVVPVYNCENYICDCIESVICQSRSDWELILVDDGSTDGSSKICDEYSAEYSNKIFAFHKENEGQFLTRKFGIQKCTGDYIGFLDADDLLDKDYIKILCENIEFFSFPDSVCFGFVQFGNGTKKESAITDSKAPLCFRNPDERKFVYRMIVNGQMPGSLCSKAFKKNVIINSIPTEEIVRSKRFAEDAYHSFDALANSDSILFINKSLYYYRDNAQGFSQGFESRDPDYFNSKYTFELIRNNLSVMDIDDEETRGTLCERNFNETIYFMLKYFRAAKSLKRKKEIIDFDWSCYLLEETVNSINRNPSIKKSYLNVWNAFRNKKYITILMREKFKKIIGW